MIRLHRAFCLCATITFLLASGAASNLFAGLDEAKDLYCKKDYAGALAQMPRETSNQRLLYLRYKTLFKLKKWDQATEALNALSGATWGHAREVIFYERLELLNARRETSLLLKEMASLPLEIENGFLQR